MTHEMALRQRETLNASEMPHPIFYCCTFPRDGQQCRDDWERAARDHVPRVELLTTVFDQGGDNPGNRNSYHPFYITDHPEGGYGLKVRAEQRLENIYAGVENLTMTPVGKGPRCEFMPKGGADKVEPY